MLGETVRCVMFGAFDSHATRPMVRRWLLLLALLVILLPTSMSRLRAQETAKLSVDPPAQTVAPSQRAFEVRVTVDDVTNEQGVGGYTLVMEYDPSVLEARSIGDSGFIESTDNPVLCPTSGIDNDEGRLAHLCLTLPILAQPGPQTSDPQLLVTVTFEPVGEGTTTLDISETKLVDAQGDDLEATTTNGQVTVGSAASPTGEPASVATLEVGSEEQSDSDGGTNIGLYIGLGVAVALVVALLGGLALWRRRAGST